MDEKNILKLPLADWLTAMEGEYLAGFIQDGGAAVKFAVLDAQAIDGAAAALAGCGRAQGMLTVHVDAGRTRVNLMQNLFFAIAEALPWDWLIQGYVERLFTANAYPWPRPGEAMRMAELAHGFAVAPAMLARQRDQWLTAELWDDTHLAQDFRAALLCLCQARLEADGPEIAAPALQWLHGARQPLAALRGAEISARITRGNARAMLASLCHFLLKSDNAGLLVVLDLRRLSQTKVADDGPRYSPATVMDSYEVLRQLIDDAEDLPGLFLAVLIDPDLAERDPRRAITQYMALQMRLWPDVAPGDRQNKVAPMVWLAP